MKKLSYIAIISASLLLCSGLGISKTLTDAEIEKKHVFSSKEIINQLTYWHYTRHSFDDKLSSELFDNYISRLDSRRQILLQSDIAEFEKYRELLDNNIKKGDLSFSHSVFERYKQRLEAHLNTTLKDWPSYIEKFNYSIDEQVRIDRSEAEWPKTLAESADLWRKQIKASALNLELSGKDKKEITKILKKRLQRQLANLKKQDSSDVFQLYMNALTELYDPHTNFLSPQGSKNFNINMSLKLQGIGAVLQNKDEEVTVVRLVPAGPADKQGELMPNDRIIAVGQGPQGEMIDVVGWELDDVVELIRGKPKSQVRLEVIRGTGSSAKHRIIQIVRDNVKLEDQSAKRAIINIMDEHGNSRKVGIIDIPTFYMDFDAYRRGDPNYKSTTRDVAKLIAELEKEQISGIIIDLRENGGGSLLEAQELTSLFIEQGPVVQIRHSNNSISYNGKRFRSNFYQGPIAVLTDRLSASASEIFAAAIQDYERGLVIGNQSYGKGTVQTLKELPYGQLKITESKFYRVSGDSTQHRGVIPDISLPELYDKEEIGESTQEHALKWDQIPPAEHINYANFKLILEHLKIKHKSRIKTDADFIYQKSLYELRNTKEEFLSLNKKKRERLDKEQEAKILAIENTHRQALGKKTLKDFAELEKETEEKIRKNTATMIDTEEDFYLQESAKILLDANQLLTKGCMLKTIKDCNNPVLQNIINRTKKDLATL